MDVTNEAWGGHTWRCLISQALDFLDPLAGKSVMELGFRDGQMSLMFASRGARVTGLEVRQEYVERARENARRHGCAADFRLYDGNLDAVGGTFDIVFTKSVLVLTDLKAVLPAIHRKLKPGGQIAFIENAAGNPLMRLARYVARSPATWRGVHYFTNDHLRLIEATFNSVQVHRTTLPPVYLICGRS